MAARASLARDGEPLGALPRPRRHARSATTTRGSTTSTSAAADDGSMELLQRPVSAYLVDAARVHPAGAHRTGAAGRHPRRGPPTADPWPGGRPQVDDAGHGEVARSPGCWSCSPSLEGTPTAAELEPFCVDPTPTYGGPRSRRHRSGAGGRDGPAGAGCSTTPSRRFAPPPRPRSASWSRCCPRTRRPGRPSRRPGHGDPVVRAAVLDVLRALALGDGPLPGAFARRRRGGPPQAVRGLVSVDSVPGWQRRRRPRPRGPVAVAHGLGRRVASAETLLRLAADDDPLVRAAALEAAGRTRAVTRPCRPVRQGAHRPGVAGAHRGVPAGLAAAPGDVAEQALLGASATRTPMSARPR